MNVLIIEDEALAVEKLKEVLYSLEDSAVVAGVTGSVKSSVEWLKNHDTPDLILMDIELSDGQSFDIFKQYDIKSPVIFTTSYDEYAIKAFKVKSVDYLLKPIDETELKAAIVKFKEVYQNDKVTGFDVHSLIQELQKQLKKTEYRDRFLVKMGQRLLTVEVKDVAYFLVNGRIYQLVTNDNKRYVIDYNLEELEQMLDPRLFFRAGRSYLVSVHSIQQIHHYFNGKLKLQLKPAVENDAVLISKEKANAFKSWMGK